MKQRVIILIDGSNFYFKLKELNLKKISELNYDKFCKFLLRNNDFVKAIYFIGKIRQDGTIKSDKMLAGQQKLLVNLKKYNVEYKLGYLLNTNGKYHEKGVDVQIAVEILIATYENLCDRIIIVSSDTDLGPAILNAKQKGKIIEYVGFSHRPSVAMVRFCSESTLLKKEDIVNFINN